jgi:predicted benzoate:H+ symporter BenE
MLNHSAKGYVFRGMAFAFLFHGLVLYFIRFYFPFGTILAIIPAAVVEDIVLAIFMLKVLGY